MKRIEDAANTARFFIDGKEVSRATALETETKNDELLKAAALDISALLGAKFIVVIEK